MKKCLLLFSLLLIGSFGFLAYLQTSLLSEKDQVTYKDEILYGDSSSIEELSMTIKAEYDHHLFWNTTYEAGQNPQVSTDYRFYPIQQEYEYVSSNGVYMDIAVMDHYFDTQKSRDEISGISQAVYDIYQDLGYNETKTIRVNLTDYYDYYPFNFSINLDDFGEYWEWEAEPDYIGDAGYYESEYYENFLFLKDFFKIPIIEGDTRIVEVSKNGGSLGYTTVYFDDNTEPFYFESFSAVTKDSIFFTFSTDTLSEGIQFDTSLIPGGYGIYKIPYKQTEKNSQTKTSVDVHSLSMVYSLEQDIQIFMMGTTKDQSKLILAYRDKTESNTKIAMIDAASMDLLQTITLDGIEKTDGSTEILLPYSIHVYDDFIALDCSSDYLAVLNLTEDGAYEIAFVVNLHENPVFDYYIWDTYRTAMAWDGEKIALAGCLRKEYGDYVYEESCGFYLAVFDKDGLVYFSEHGSSLDRGAAPYASASVKMLYENMAPALELKWE